MISTFRRSNLLALATLSICFCETVTPSGHFCPVVHAVGGGNSAEGSAELIEQLSSDSFTVRQAAARELLRLGYPVAEALRRAELSGTAEQRERIRLLLRQIHRQEYRERLSRLQQDPVAASAARLPEWDRFSRLLGENSDILNLYTEILLTEPELFALRLFDREELPAALEQRSSDLARLFDGQSEREFPAASAAALLLLGSNVETRLLRATSTNISSMLADERLDRLLQDGKQRAVLRLLLDEWIQRPGIAAERPLIFAVRHRLDGGRILARRIIENRSRRPDMLVAILSLGVLGQEEDIARLEELFRVETVLWPIGGARLQRTGADGQPRNTDYSVQTRDAALAVAASLRGIDLRQLGIQVRPSDLTLFAADSLGFESDATRSAAFASYQRLIATANGDR